MSPAKRKRVRFGSLRQTDPVSSVWGTDRGTPVDRVYIERFLEAEREAIHGDVLEIGGNGYTRRFGLDGLTSHVMDVDADNHHATIVADLTDASSVPSDSFDCCILTQVLQYVPDVMAALLTTHRILKPGGVALVTVPGIAQLDLDSYDQVFDTWRFTPRSLRSLGAEVFGPDAVAVSSWGNVLSAMAFLQGLAAEDLSPSELAHVDLRYPLLISLRAVKG